MFQNADWTQKLDWTTIWNDIFGGKWMKLIMKEKKMKESINITLTWLQNEACLTGWNQDTERRKNERHGQMNLREDSQPKSDIMVKANEQKQQILKDDATFFSSCFLAKSRMIG